MSIRSSLIVLLAAWVAVAPARADGINNPGGSGSGGSGTVNAGLINQLGYYAAGGTTISGSANITTSSTGQLIVIPATPHLAGNGAAVLINGNTAGEVTFTHPVAVHVQGADGENDGFHVSAYGTNTVGAFIARHALGTAASPLAETVDTQLLKIAGWGYRATGYSNNIGGMGLFAAGTFTDTSTPTYVSLFTNAVATTNSIVEVLRGQPGGGVSVGNAAYNATDRATGILAVQTGLTIASTAQIFPASGLIVGTTDAQTLTNKTLTSPTLTGLELINNNAAAPPAPLAGTALQIAGVDATSTGIEVQGFQGVPTIVLRNSGGTGATPAATPAGTVLGNLQWGGFGTASVGGAAIRVTAINTWSVSDTSTKMLFRVTPSGSTANTTSMQLQGSGGLSVGPANVGTDGGAGVVVATSFTGAGTGLTGTAASLTAGTVTTNANLTGPITSVGNATSIAAQTGTGTTFVMSAGPTLTGSLTLSSAGFITSGNLSAAAWTTNGVRTQMAAASYTDTSSSGTIANAYTDLFGVGTILASSATTYTNYYGAFFKAPVASTNVTMTNKSALGADTISIGGAAQGATALAVTGAANISGAIVGGNNITATFDLTLGGANNLTFSGRGTLSSPSTGKIQHGAADIASPVAQTIQMQSVVAGNANTAGANATIQGSLSNGSGGGDILIKTTLSVAASGTQNTAATALTFKGGDQSIIAASTTDATSTSTGALQIAGGMSITKRVFAAGLTASAGLQTAVICLSSANELIADSVACLASSERFKQDIAPSDLGLAAVMAMKPIVYRYAPTGNDRFDNAPNQRDIHAGFRAEDLARIDRRLVAFDADGAVRTARQDGITASLVKAMQEQQAQIDTLRRASR